MTNTKNLIKQVQETIQKRVNDFDQAATDYLEIKENDESVLYTNHITTMKSLAEDIEKLFLIISRLKDAVEALTEDETYKLENYDEEQTFNIDMAAMEYKEILEEYSDVEEL